MTDAQGVFIAMTRTLLYQHDTPDEPPDNTLHDVEPFETYIGAIDWLRERVIEDAFEHGVPLNDAFKWGGDVEKEYALPMTCGICKLDPYHELDHIKGVVSASVTKYGTVFNYADGKQLKVFNVPRWALTIDGEQNWEDVVG